MKELTLATLIAVFEEMFGRGLFWALVAAAVLVAVLFLWVLWRDRGVAARRLVRAELFAPLGAVAAVAFVLWITRSGLGDIGGPIDVVILLAIALAGAAGLTLAAYVAQALLRRRPG